MAANAEQQIAECVNTDTEHCDINCESTDCDGRVIDATDKDSLTVICHDDFSEDGCADLDIICPADGDCTIHCDMVSGCDRLNVTHNAFSDDGYINEGNINLLCSADLSCRNIHVDAPNANRLIINATAYNSLTHSQIHAEDANSFILQCNNEDEAFAHFRACNNDYLYLSDHANDRVEVNCHGKGCGKLDFFVEDEFSRSDRIELNVKSECDCDGWDDCTDSIGIYCDSYDVNITDGEFTSYGTFVRITDGVCSDRDSCGCAVFTDRVRRNYDGSCPNVTESSMNLMNTTAEAIEFNTDTTTGTIMGIVMALGAVVFLLYFSVNRKFHRQVQSTRFRAATKGVVKRPIVDFEEEPSVSIIEDGVPTKR